MELSLPLSLITHKTDTALLEKTITTKQKGIREDWLRSTRKDGDHQTEGITEEPLSDLDVACPWTC